MGPTIIFDKSFLESLSPDEAMWLDHFFITNITPLFFIETLADLEKVRKGRAPEKIVGDLAYKTPDMSSKLNTHHTSLLEGELWGGQSLNLKNGIIYVSDGKRYELAGKTGVFFQPSKEEEAFSRWQKNDFFEFERLVAKEWRKSVLAINLEEIYPAFKKFFPIGKPRNLTDLKKMVDFYIDVPDQETVFTFGLTLLGVAPLAQTEVIIKWKEKGKPAIKEFSPYFRYVFSVDLFFYLAISADLIGRGRPSHKIDLAYLYYLPFCSIFISNDNLHSDIVPFFLRENQTFVQGNILKDDLKALDTYYNSFAEDIKKLGIFSFAPYPPKDGDFLVASLWDKHASPKWRERDNKKSPMPDDKILKHIKEEMHNFKEKGNLVTDMNKAQQPSPDSITIERRVRGRMGKWNRFPPEVLNKRMDETDKE